MLPVKPFKRMMKLYTGKRVSEAAAIELRDYVEKKLSLLFKTAAILARHSGRKTVLSSDIKLARKTLNL